MLIETNFYDNFLDIIKKPIYIVCFTIIHLFYFAVFFKIISSTPEVITYLNIFIQIFISLFLILKFHPFRNHTLKPFDASIIFGSGIFLLTNLGFTELLRGYFTYLPSLYTNAEKLVM